MAYQLIYTSVSRGLIPGRSGYTVAARHRQIRDRMVSDIERLSGYTFATSGVSPVIYAHRKISCSGKDYHVLTRNKDAGSDYTGRTNHLAHHLICEPEEIAACGASPAEVLHGFNWLESYTEEPRYLEDHEVIDLGQFAGTFTLPARNWQGVRGEGGDAALLVNDEGKPGSAFVVASSADDNAARQLLAMYGESLQLTASSGETPAKWRALFTTYLQQVDTLADFDWAGCTGEQTLLQRPGNRLVLDLSSLGVPTPDSKLAKLAVTGQAEPPPPTHRKPARPPAPDAFKQASAVPQSGGGTKGGQRPDQSRRVTFTPVDSKEGKKSPGPLNLTGSRPIPVPSVSLSPSGAGKLDFLKRPENLRFVIGGGAAALLALVVLCYYLFSVHPRQDFQAEVRGNIANLYWQGAMDVIEKEKGDMDAELIDELSREVLAAMIAQVEEINERYATEKGENVKQLEEEVSEKIAQLVQFEEKYSLSSQDVGDLVTSFNRIKRAKSNAGSLNSGVVSSTPGKSPGDGNVAKPKGSGKGEVAGNKNDNKPLPDASGAKEKEEEVLPNAVYLFLNDQSVGLDKVQYNESWANLQAGKEGERKVALRHYGLSSGNLLLLDPSSGDSYHYKFPESAEEESSDGYFPIDGNLNIKVMFKGGKTALLKRESTGTNAKNAWDRAKSNLFAFEGQGNRFQVLLWNGVPFRVTKVKPFTMSGKVVSVTDGFGRYLASFRAGNAFETKAEPEEVFMRYVSGRSSAGEKLFFESERLKVPIQAHRQLSIDFSGNGDKSRDDVAGLERKINEAGQSIANYENYRRWFAYREYLKKDLGQMGRDYITRFKEKDYPQICDPGNFSKEDDVREQILEFAEDVVDGFPDALEDQGVGDSDVRRVTFSLSAKKFSELSFATTVAGFKRGMDAFAESCRDLAESSYRDDDGDRVYRIRDRDAREEIEEFARRWEDFFGGEKGERLWHFVAAKPKVPQMTEKEYSLMKRRLQDLTRRKAAADKASRRFDLLDTSGMPPGIYEIVFVFGGDRQMPFVIWSKEGQRGK